MLFSSFPSYTRGGLMPLAGAPRDLYMQLLACSSSQSVVAIACCLRAILCFGFCLLAVSACTMTARQTNSSLAASLDGENSPSDTVLHAESSVPLSLTSTANSAPQTSSTVSAPVVTACVHGPPLIAVMIDAFKASLVAEKRPWFYLEQFVWSYKQLLGAFPPHHLACPSKRRPLLLLEAPFRCIRQYLYLQPLKVGLILLCHPLLPLLQPCARRF